MVQAYKRNLDKVGYACYYWAIHSLEGGIIMEEYRVPYLILFNRVTDALEALEKDGKADVRDMLIRAQQEAEEAFTAAEGDVLEKERAFAL